VGKGEAFVVSTATSVEEVQATGVEGISVSVALMSNLNRIQRPLLAVDRM